jgi:hypothetical protein
MSPMLVARSPERQILAPTATEVRLMGAPLPPKQTRIGPIVSIRRLQSQGREVIARTPEIMTTIRPVQTREGQGGMPIVRRRACTD